MVGVVEVEKAAGVGAVDTGIVVEGGRIVGLKEKADMGFGVALVIEKLAAQAVADMVALADAGKERFPGVGEDMPPRNVLLDYN